LPIAVGFGISTAEQAREVANIADAVVVGSAIVKRIGENATADISEFVAPLVSAVKEIRAHDHDRARDPVSDRRRQERS
jgi:tryptophan synthase alpha chain